MKISLIKWVKWTFEAGGNQPEREIIEFWRWYVETKTEKWKVNRNIKGRRNRKSSSTKGKSVTFYDEEWERIRVCCGDKEGSCCRATIKK